MICLKIIFTLYDFVLQWMGRKRTITTTTTHLENKICRSKHVSHHLFSPLIIPQNYLNALWWMELIIGDCRTELLLDRLGSLVSTGTRHENMPTTRPNIPMASGGWAVTITAEIRTVMYSPGATSQRMKKGSTGSIVTSQPATVSAGLCIEVGRGSANVGWKSLVHSKILMKLSEIACCGFVFIMGEPRGMDENPLLVFASVKGSLPKGAGFPSIGPFRILKYDQPGQLWSERNKIQL